MSYSSFKKTIKPLHESLEEAGKKTPNLDATVKRQAQVDAGAYDGRFKSRVVQDKRKKADKEACRKYRMVGEDITYQDIHNIIASHKELSYDIELEIKKIQMYYQKLKDIAENPENHDQMTITSLRAIHDLKGAIKTASDTIELLMKEKGYK